MANGTHTLYVITLIIFGALGLPTLFILWRHGRHGILGWFYLQLLCLITVIGAIVELKAIANNTTKSTGVVIINSVGLSPLLLAALGIMHEARRARNKDLRKKLEWFLVISMHILVSLGLIVMIIGIVKVEDKKEAPNTSHVIKFGLLVVFICWLTLCAWALWSLKGHPRTDPMFYANGTALLKGVLISLPFIGMRLIYGILSFVLKSQSFANSLGWRIFLDVIPSAVVVTVLVIVGFITRNMWRERAPENKIEAYVQQTYPQQTQRQKPYAPGEYPTQGQAF
ncbi:hypothetical protein D0Z07_5006 [Hyphodiscus hymeniophilus]|uniref:DUF7702 domain-containing protein n=1 Tax=Hyphodiscus hymeniophilus TaxID=353542 RepID=A0A9P7AX55_9HELO|nr:hypothetical protein D0Z07_5006 [Hyphodiscus hymeniophilus]